MKSHKLFLFTMAACMTTYCASSCGPKEYKRPDIIGVAHAAFFTSDFENTCSLFRDFFGYENPITVYKDSGKVNLTTFKINDRQYVEIFPEREKDSPRFYHFAIETDDAEAMRLYLKSKGVKVPDKTPKGRTGNYNYFVEDPNGVICEIVQYADGGETAANYGKAMPESRISANMSHVGIQCPNLDKAMSFYCDILGFTETWRGGPDPAKVKWVHLKAPESDQTIELMLYDSEPDKAKKGSMNHICLTVDDVFAAKEILDSRPFPSGCHVTPPSVGINKKRQINYYDCDGTRIEIMETRTVDGTPAESSKGVPMKYGKPVK